MRNRARMVAFLGMMTAVSLVLSYVEALIPWFPSLPGVKIGLSNLVVLFLLYRSGAASAGTVSLARILLAGILFSGPLSILYSLTGGSFSFLAMLLLKKSKRFSSVGVSAAGGAMHNVGQILVARLVMGSDAVFYYLPHLLFFGTLFGALLGGATAVLLLKYPKQEKV